jgi:hypothetical protein
MDEHHFNYITKLEKKRGGINENAIITWANHYGWPIKSR